jgi:selenocysteine lyase/cysteine desulfurase
VRVALRRGAIRASLHVYNDDTDVDRFLDILDAAVAKLPARPPGVAGS